MEVICKYSNEDVIYFIKCLESNHLDMLDEDYFDDLKNKLENYFHKDNQGDRILFCSHCGKRIKEKESIIEDATCTYDKHFSFGDDRSTLEFMIRPRKIVIGKTMHKVYEYKYCSCKECKRKRIDIKMYSFMVFVAFSFFLTYCVNFENTVGVIVVSFLSAYIFYYFFTRHKHLHTPSIRESFLNGSWYISTHELHKLKKNNQQNNWWDY